MCVCVCVLQEGGQAFFFNLTCFVCVRVSQEGLFFFFFFCHKIGSMFLFVIFFSKKTSMAPLEI